MQQRSVDWRLRRHLGDGALAVAAWYAAVLLRVHVPLPFTEGLLPADRVALAHPVSLLVVALQLLSLYFLGFYESPEPRPRLQLLLRLATAAAAVGIGLTAYFFLADRTFPRSVLLVFVVLDWLLLATWRLVGQSLHRPRRRRVVLVGGGRAARELAEKIGQHHWHGLDVVGWVRAPGDGPGAAIEPMGPCLGEVADVPSLVAAGRCDDVILVSGDDSWQARLLDRLAATRSQHPNVLLLPGPFESLIGRMRYRWVSDVPLIDVVAASEWTLHRPWKRLLDSLAGGLLLLLSLPLLGVAASMVRLTSPGPVLYRQVRVGQGQRPFTLYKLRTMRMGAEEGEEVLAVYRDPRLTPVGALLRRTRIDELPQLFNVLAGTMSLVGPRPERPGFVGRYLQTVPGYAERFSLPPGLTGLAQVNGDYHSSPENKLRYDLAYVANRSLWLDLSILVRTVRIVLTSRGV